MNLSNISPKDFDQSKGTLPQGWEQVLAQDICSKVQSGSTPKGKPFTETGEVPYLKVYNIVDQEIDFDYRPQFISKEIHKEKLTRSIVLSNDVLMNIVGPPLGKVALVTEQYPEWNINQALVLFRPQKGLLNFYLYYYLVGGQFIREILAETKGSVGQVNISLTQCRNCPIPLPPLNEQHRIVAKIEALTTRSRKARAALDAIPPLLDQFRQSVLAAAFRGDLTADWRAQNPDVEPAEKLLEHVFKLPKGYKRLRKQLGKGFINREGCSFIQLPDTWKYASIDELYKANIIVDYADGNHGSLYPRKSEFEEQGVIYITASQVMDGGVDFNSCSYLNHEKAKQLVKGWARGGDVLLTHNATVGRTAIVPDEVGDFLLGTSVTFYRTHVEGLNSRYLYYALSSHVWQQQLHAVMQQTTRNQVSIQKQAFFLVPIPPIEEQLVIVEKIDSFLERLTPLESLFQTETVRYDQLDQSILAKAFRGELVPQDSNDESASVLLERIRTERKKFEKKGKGRKGKSVKSE